jgi:methionine sulfoxide reductase heme-binding subunit
MKAWISHYIINPLLRRLENHKMANLFKRYTPLQIIVHIGAWFPLAHLIFDFTTGNLSPNIIQDLELRTGRAAILMLILTLVCRPLHTLFGWREPLKRSRTLGLYAFMYATIHMLIFVELDYGLAWSLITQNIIQKPRLIVGILAFLLLVPLAITSFDIWKVRLGKNWKRLHRIIYVIAPLAILHYAWSRKGDIFALQGDILQPLIYGLILAVLLILRIPPVRKSLASLRTWRLFTLTKQSPTPNTPR